MKIVEESYKVEVTESEAIHSKIIKNQVYKNAIEFGDYKDKRLNNLFKSIEYLKDSTEVRESIVTLMNEMNMLKGENTLLHEEISTANGKLKELVVKYQESTKEYNEQISALIKEKQEFSKRIHSLESELKVAKLKNATYNFDYTEQIVKKGIMTNDESLEAHKDQHNYIQILVGLEKRYIDQLNEITEKYTEIEQVKIELSKELQTKIQNEQEAKEKVINLEKENELLKNKNELLTVKLKDHEANQLNNNVNIRQLSDLHKKNIELTSQLEQLKTVLEDKSETNSVHMKAQCILLEYERNTLRTYIAKYNTKIEKLSNELRKVQDELSGKDYLEEILRAKEIVIKSLEMLVRKLLDGREDNRFVNILNSNKEVESLRTKCFQLQEVIKAYNVKMSLNSRGVNTEGTTVDNKKILEELVNKLQQDKTNKKEDKSNNKANKLNKEPKNSLLRSQQENGNIIKELQAKLEESERERKKEIEKLKAELEEIKEDKITKEERAEEEIEVLESKVKEDEARIKELEEEIQMIQKSKELAQQTMNSERTVEEKLQDLALKYLKKNKHARDYEAQLEKAKEDLVKVNKVIEKIEMENTQLKEEAALQKVKMKTLLNNKANTSTDGKPLHNFPSEKGDCIDQMFDHYMKQAKCQVKFKKLDNGQYMFGSKKIYAKIQNEKLIIRVGGGYMMIEDFLTAYTEQELMKEERDYDSSNEERKTETQFVNERLSSSQKRIEGHSILSGSTSKGMGDRARASSKERKDSCSHSLGLINGTNRTRVLTEQDVLKAKKPSLPRPVVERVKVQEDDMKDSTGTSSTN